MKTSSINVEMEFVEPLLGSAPNNPDIHAEYIASKAPTIEKHREETAAIARAAQADAEDADDQANPADDLDTEIAKKVTVFPRDNHGLHLWDYQIRGHFKEAIYVLIELGHPTVKGLSKWTYKRAVDTLLFVRPRRVYLLNPTGKPWMAAPSRLQRPLRADTRQGERIALASSEQLPIGTTCAFQVEVIEGNNPKSKLAVLGIETIKACLDYGGRRGFGQWRGGGFGRYEWKEAQGE